jgi:PEP-CTERM motif
MTHLKTVLLSATLIFTTTIGTATAGTIFQNGATDLQNGVKSDLGQSILTLGADDFQLQTGFSTITDVHWFGFFRTDESPAPLTDNFSIRFYGDNGGVPMVNFLHEVLVGNSANSTDTGLQVDGEPAWDLFKYDVDIAPIVLNPGTTYWLSIVNNTPDDGWFWAADVTVGGQSAVGLGSLWFPISNFEFAFSLTDDLINPNPNPNPVPEPSTMILLGTGLAGIIAWRRKHSV